jgi:hypothetical protein
LFGNINSDNGTNVGKATITDTSKLGSVVSEFSPRLISLALAKNTYENYYNGDPNPNKKVDNFDITSI